MQNRNAGRFAFLVAIAASGLIALTVFAASPAAAGDRKHQQLRSEDDPLYMDSAVVRTRNNKARREDDPLYMEGYVAPAAEQHNATLRDGDATYDGPPWFPGVPVRDRWRDDRHDMQGRPFFRSPQ
jgi:hypothetical protein